MALFRHSFIFRQRSGSTDTNKRFRDIFSANLVYNPMTPYKYRAGSKISVIWWGICNAKPARLECEQAKLLHKPSVLAMPFQNHLLVLSTIYIFFSSDK